MGCKRLDVENRRYTRQITDVAIVVSALLQLGLIEYHVLPHYRIILHTKEGANRHSVEQKRKKLASRIQLIDKPIHSKVISHLAQ